VVVDAPPAQLPVQALAPQAAFEALRTSRRGLSAVDAAQRLAEVGANELPPPRHPPLWLRFAKQFTDLFAVVLLVAAAITFLAYLIQQPSDVGNLQLAIAIVCVVVLNATIGFAQEYSAERTAQALQARSPARRWSPATSSCWRQATPCLRTAVSSRRTPSPSTTPR